MWRKITAARKWLYPGLGVKRWLLLLLLGITLLGTGLARLLDSLYLSAMALPATQRALILAFLPGWVQDAVLALVGLGLAGWATYQFNHSLLAVFMPPGSPDLVDAVYWHRQRQRGPKVVVVGGGTGL